MSFDFYVANVYASVQRGLTVIPPQFLRWDTWVEKLSMPDWDISGSHTGAKNSGNGSMLSTPKAASELLHSSEVGAIPKLLGAKSCTGPGCKEIF